MWSLPGATFSPVTFRKGHYKERVPGQFPWAGQPLGLSFFSRSSGSKDSLDAPLAWEPLTPELESCCQLPAAVCDQHSCHKHKPVPLFSRDASRMRFARLHKLFIKLIVLFCSYQVQGAEAFKGGKCTDCKPIWLRTVQETKYGPGTRPNTEDASGEEPHHLPAPDAAGNTLCSSW